MNLWNLLVMANKASYYVCNKYQVTEATSEKEEDKVIPLLRLSEMYLIAIEAGPETEAQRLWKEFLSARNLVNCRFTFGGCAAESGYYCRIPERILWGRRYFFFCINV